MTPNSLDYERSLANPWGLTQHQCMTLRLVCQHGGTKRAAWAEKDVNTRTLEHHLLKARNLMGLVGSDVRLYLQWDRWTRKDNVNE